MDLLDTVDPVVRAALQKRIRDLRITDGTFGARVVSHLTLHLTGTDGEGGTNRMTLRRLD